MLLLLSCVPWAFGAGTPADLIAHYRFDTNGLDSLGLSPPFYVLNVAQPRSYTPSFIVAEPPFTHGVLYVNGRYEPNGSQVSYLSTPPNKRLHYSSFTVALNFYPLPENRSQASFSRFEQKLDQWTRGRYARWRGVDPNLGKIDNILTGGYGYRWIGFNRQGGVLNLTLNNQAFSHPFNSAAVRSRRWHRLICSVDLDKKKVLTLFDGRLLETITLPADFKLEVIDSPFDARDHEFTFGNYSNGSVFFGYAAHLKIFGRGLAESELAELDQQSLNELPKFPPPQSPWLPALVLLSVACLAVVVFVWWRSRSRLRQLAQASG